MFLSMQRGCLALEVILLVLVVCRMSHMYVNALWRSKDKVVDLVAELAWNTTQR